MKNDPLNVDFLTKELDRLQKELDELKNFFNHHAWNIKQALKDLQNQDQSFSNENKIRWGLLNELFEIDTVK